MKKGVSPVIATVLLLVITVVLVAIIAAFAVPFVRDSLNDKSECFDVVGEIDVANTGYNCHTTVRGGRTGFSVGINDANIVGFRALLYRTGSAEPYEIKNGTSLENIAMLNGTFNVPLDLPKKGGVRTYVANGVFEKVEIYPIVESGNQCDKAASLQLNPCIDAVIAAEIGASG